MAFFNSAIGVLQTLVVALGAGPSDTRKAPAEGALRRDAHSSASITSNSSFFKEDKFMAFFNSAIGVLQTLVVALGAGLGVWGAINLLEGYGNDNPGAKSQGMKQLIVSPPVGCLP